MSNTPQLIILGQMVHYIDEQGVRYAAFVSTVRGQGVVDLHTLLDAGGLGFASRVPYDRTETVKPSWHTTLCTGCKRMAVGYEKTNAK